MILLIAAPRTVRTILTEALKDEGQTAILCDTFETGMETYSAGQQIDLIVAEHRIGDSSVQDFRKKLASHGRAVPVIVVDAPPKAEAGLFRSGAASVWGKDYSPRSVALQCLSLKILLSQHSGAKRGPAHRPVADFKFGPAVVSLEQRHLQPTQDHRGRIAPVPLSRIQIRFLSALHAAPGKILSYEFIYHLVWRRAYRGKNGAIREAVSSLRKRFRRVGVDLDRSVKTVHGEGYRYDPA